ncbi:hypothetical protein MMC24_003838 [Lignoscripta atroalba]|nr:hypothetical protein [Lignoscripta atroalba]
MFSYLHGIRPNARRAALHPTATSEEFVQPAEYHDRPLSFSESNVSFHPQRRLADESLPSISSISSNPPVLPPIPRVASRYGQQVHPQDRRREVKDDTGHLAAVENTLRDRDYPQARNASADAVPRANDRGNEAVYEDQLLRHSQRARGIASEARPPTMLQHRTPMLLESQGRSYSEPVSSQPNSAHQNFSKSSQTLLEINSGPVKSLQSTGPGTNQVRHNKTKLNLLNPMSLLARRRSAQAAAQASDDLLTHSKTVSVPGTRLPDDYDPRIRGKVIHDFSAPRPKRYFSTNDAQLTHSRLHTESRPELYSTDHTIRLQHDVFQSAQGGTSPTAVERGHTPIFKEHFGDDVEPWRIETSDRVGPYPEDLEYEVALHDSQPKLASLPPFARNLPADFLRTGNSTNAGTVPLPKAPLEVVLETDRPNTAPALQRLESSPPTKSPKARSRATSGADASFQSVGLPKHLSSNASRFSFDLAGVGSSTQETLLEEKHRQQAAQKLRASAVSTATTTGADGRDNDDDELYYNDMDDDEGLEERIPGVNTDADAILDHEDMLLPGRAIEALNFSSPLKSTPISPASVVSTGFASIETACDDHGQLIRYASTKQSPELRVQHGTRTSPKSSNGDGGSIASNQSRSVFGPNDLPGFYKQSSTMELISSRGYDPRQANLHERHYAEDDLYFDDGLIEDIDEGDGLGFDESVFDDNKSRIYGLPLRDWKPLTVVHGSSGSDADHPPTRPISLDNTPMMVRTHKEEAGGSRAAVSVPDIRGLEQMISVHGNQRAPQPVFQQPVGLTHDNLTAYHDALALATNQAALNGKFDRKASLSDNQAQVPNEEHESVSRILKQGHTQALFKIPQNGVTDETEDFDFDDALEDDPIIAAANAEALENDDDGFYGQEFGFYAHAIGSGEAQYANGGYFGPKGPDGIGRSRSGRVNLQEPSLTPITERSEWSNRNSTISLALHGGYASTTHSGPSAGLAQLADMMPLEDESMSLSALMKLRRGAWGGSNGSLQSSAGSHNSGSPVAYLSPMTSGGILGNNGFGSSNLAGSSYSLVSSNGIASDEELSPASPTITLQTTGLSVASPPPQMKTDRSSGSDTSPVRRNAVKGIISHSRTSSGAESVSYVKETDEDGAGRWVLEKRRTAEGGLVEILGRQIVEGGRI